MYVLNQGLMHTHVCIWLCSYAIFVHKQVFSSDESEIIKCNTEKDRITINHHTAGMQ